MEVALTPEIQSLLEARAAAHKTTAGEFVRRLIEMNLEEDIFVVRSIERAREQLSRGEFLSTDEVLARVERVLAKK